MRHRPTSEVRGVAQLANYLESLGLTEGWLVLFDPSRGDDWDARIWPSVKARAVLAPNSALAPG